MTTLPDLPILSIQQPYPYAIIHCGKDIENRTWWTPYRGPFLIHAGKKWYSGMGDGFADIQNWSEDAGLTVPQAIEDVPLGGIVGMAEIVDCVRQSDSKWFNGPYGFVLRNAKPLPFVPMCGQLGWFRAPKIIESQGEQQVPAKENTLL